MKTVIQRMLSGLTVLGGLGLMTACVSQAEYDESVGLAKSYQNQMYERDKALVDCQRERDELLAELRSSRAGVINSSFDESMEGRLSELQSMLDGLDRPPGDIERFDVEGGYVFMIQDKVLFDSGSALIGEEGKPELMKLAQEINGAPHGRIVVRGHTDSDRVVRPETLKKFPNGNMQLSAERAVSVGAFLEKEGKVSGRDLVVAGYGPHEPVRANDSADNKRLNRRVEIFVADPEGR